MTHPLFADWHREVDIDPSRVDLDGRWAVVEGFGQKLTNTTAVAVLRLAHEQPADAAIVTAFATAFQAREASFPMRENARLLAMLAGAAIVYAISREDLIATLLAYGIESASAVGWQSLVKDVRNEASAYLQRKGEKLRQLTPQPAHAKLPVAWSKGQKDQLDATTTLPEIVKLMADFAVATQTNLGALATQNDVLRTWVAATTWPLVEENQMLWWLLSGWSVILNQAWASAQPGTAAVVGAWELAKLVRSLPGPPAADQLLAQLIDVNVESGSSHSTTLRAAASGVEAKVEMTTRPEVEDGITDLTPILALLHGRAVNNTITKKSVPPADLARRSYTEVLLVRAFREAR